jgi:hypothetical protein
MRRAASLVVISGRRTARSIISTAASYRSFSVFTTRS